jgi:hypothetical protein
LSQKRGDAQILDLFKKVDTFNNDDDENDNNKYDNDNVFVSSIIVWLYLVEIYDTRNNIVVKRE